jgi:hypothetical protein
MDTDEEDFTHRGRFIRKVKTLVPKKPCLSVSIR